MNPKILLIIPAFNASKYIPELVRRIKPNFDLRDVLIINDGSSDDTANIARGCGCRFIDFKKNRGKGAALRTGFKFALNNNYDAVITIDADLQHKPEHLSEFLARYDTADILIGTRSIKVRQMPWERLINNNLTSLIISIFGSVRIRDSQSGYRLLKVEVLKKLSLKSSRYDTESEMLFQSGYLGFSTAEVPIETIYDDSVSFINPLLDTSRFICQIWKRLWY